MSAKPSDRLSRWKRDPCAFFRECLIDPETNRPFELYAAEERFFREALTPTADGRLPFPELVYSGPKKSGKTGAAAMATILCRLSAGRPMRRGLHGGE
jgi:hypothetical protein